MPSMKGNPGQTYRPRSGNSYVADTNGNMTVAGGDVVDMLNEGAGLAPSSSQVQSLNGIYPTAVRLAEFKNTDGSPLSAAASAGKFGLGITLGTTFGLVSEAANSNTKTDDAIIEFLLPSNYVAGKNLTVTANASINGAGTLTTKTLQVKLFRIGTDGTSSADLIASTQNIVAAGADIAFTATGTTLSPGDKLLLQIETVLTETAAVATNAKINSVRVS